MKGILLTFIVFLLTACGSAATVDNTGWTVYKTAQEAGTAAGITFEMPELKDRQELSNYAVNEGKDALRTVFKDERSNNYFYYKTASGTESPVDVSVYDSNQQLKTRNDIIVTVYNNDMTSYVATWETEENGVKYEHVLFAKDGVPKAMFIENAQRFALAASITPPKS